MEAGLDAGDGAGDQVIGDLLFAQVPDAATTARIGVRIGQRRGPGADRAVDREIAAEGMGTGLRQQLPSLLRIAHRGREVAADPDRSIEGQQRRQIGATRFVAGTALVHLDDPSGGRRLQEGELRRTPLAGREFFSGNGSDCGVGLLGDRSGGRPAGQRWTVRHARPQC